MFVPKINYCYCVARGRLLLGLERTLTDWESERSLVTIVCATNCRSKDKQMCCPLCRRSAAAAYDINTGSGVHARDKDFESEKYKYKYIHIYLLNKVKSGKLLLASMYV